MPDATSKRAAFFDLDKTLIPGSSLFLLARGAYKQDLFRVRDLMRFGWGQAMFRLRGESSHGIDSTRESTLDFVTGRSQRDMLDMGREIVEQRIIPRVYPDIVRVIEDHQDRGDLTFLVTAAPIELADAVAASLDMTGAIGTTSEVDSSGFYTGRLVGDVIHGPAKVKAVAEIASEHELDLYECSAYSDSINDLPLLESVGDAHAVNPDRELLRVARARGWHVHELRTKRRVLLIGVPAGMGGAALFGGGVALGTWMERRKYWTVTRRASKIRRRIAKRFFR